MPKTKKSRIKEWLRYGDWAVEYCAKRGIMEVIRRAARDPANHPNDAVATRTMSRIFRDAKSGSADARKLWMKASGFGQGRKVTAEGQTRDDAYVSVMLATSRIAALGELIDDLDLTRRLPELKAEIVKSYDAAKARADSGPKTKLPMLPLSNKVRLSRPDLYKIFAAMDRVLEPLPNRKQGPANLSGRTIEMRLGRLVTPRKRVRSRKAKK